MSKKIVPVSKHLPVSQCLTFFLKILALELNCYKLQFTFSFPFLTPRFEIKKPFPHNLNHFNLSPLSSNKKPPPKPEPRGKFKKKGFPSSPCPPPPKNGEKIISFFKKIKRGGAGFYLPPNPGNPPGAPPPLIKKRCFPPF
jgi:hypothetical protein